VFITSDASQVCVISGADKLVADCMELIADLIKQFEQNSGKIWLCPVCAKVKGIVTVTLIAGVGLAGAPKATLFLARGAKVLA
jgi:predicted peroxiredoxin